MSCLWRLLLSLEKKRTDGRKEKLLPHLYVFYLEEEEEKEEAER